MTLIISGNKDFESKIYLIRGEKVMLDFDLAELYQVPTKQLNQQVKRNLYRFPSEFMFYLSDQELINLKSQIVTSSLDWGGRRKRPSAFTEHGIAMLSSVLNSRRAIEKRIAELESKSDRRFKIVFDAIREIMSKHAVPSKRIIGLGPDGKK